MCVCECVHACVCMCMHVRVCVCECVRVHAYMCVLRGGAHTCAPCACNHIIYQRPGMHVYTVDYAIACTHMHAHAHPRAPLRRAHLQPVHLKPAQQVQQADRLPCCHCRPAPHRVHHLLATAVQHRRCARNGRGALHLPAWG